MFVVRSVEYVDGLGKMNDSIESFIGPEMSLFCFQQQRGLIDMRASELIKKRQDICFVLYLRAQVS